MLDLPILRRAHTSLVARWLFLRALGLIFFSAFYSLAFQVHGLIGARGVLPVADYLARVSGVVPGLDRFWEVPTLFWLDPRDSALTIAVAVGLASSFLLVANIWPRANVALCTLLFLAFVAALQDFSMYQSDGMLLEAGFISIFFAPAGARPRLGASDPPSRLSLFMLRWEWFRIYFESGLVKLMSGDVHWRNFTAMDEYYQNGPLPAWPGWYVQHFPHWYHAGTVVITFAVELVIVWAVFLPHRVRIACFAVVTALQIGIISTANYAFLNYLVLVLGLLLFDDTAARWIADQIGRRVPALAGLGPEDRPAPPPLVGVFGTIEAVMLAWIFYATFWAFASPGSPNPLALPERALEPFRIANGYGLFATMTDNRYEIEFQGSNDGGATWTPYQFRYRPQNVDERPGIYAPYQPRFEWNLWFASLGPWQASTWVVAASAQLVQGSPAVLSLFRSDPFHANPPAQVRTVLWQYWFTDAATKRATGAWWRRKELGVFAGTVTRQADGQVTFRAAGQ
ncbi:MAG TPA: lipase maturation factor family protein [Gemmatimonadaceae bacterium]|jgi:hypothetical protein